MNTKEADDYLQQIISRAYRQLLIELDSKSEKRFSYLPQKSEDTQNVDMSQNSFTLLPKIREEFF